MHLTTRSDFDGLFCVVPLKDVVERSPAIFQCRSPRHCDQGFCEMRENYGTSMWVTTLLTPVTFAASSYAFWRSAAVGK
jgi:hypothetical protein